MGLPAALPKPIGTSLNLRNASPANAPCLCGHSKKGHATEAAELLLRTLEESLRVFEKHRQVIFDRLEAKQRSLLSDGAPVTHPSVEDVSGSRSLSQTLGFRYSRTSRKGLQ